MITPIVRFRYLNKVAKPYWERLYRPLLAMGLLPLIASCSTVPIDQQKLHDSPVSFLRREGAEAHDDRGRFREILCTLNDAHGRRFSSFRPCDAMLHRFPDEPPGSGKAVRLGNARPSLRIGVVGGLGADCVADFITPLPFALDHLQSQGYATTTIRVDGLSSSMNNGRQIRDSVMGMDLLPGERLLLIGYSKGTPDILEGLVQYPELETRVAAVVSIAGAVGGSPLAYRASQATLELIEYLPGAKCDDGDKGAVKSLEPEVRKRFLREHALPPSVQYFTISAFADRPSISSALRSGYDQLAPIDPRNDGQTIFFDQVIPNSHILGFIKADHWAAALPIARQWPNLAAIFVDRNDFPRAILLEAVVRYVEERLLDTPESAATFLR